MTNDQLRQALRELNGERRLGVVFANVFSPTVGIATMEVNHLNL